MEYNQAINIFNEEMKARRKHQRKMQTIGRRRK